MKILIPFLITAASLPAVAFAQVAPPESAEAGRALSQHLNTLSTDSRNVHALIGAGEAALALDDANAAIGFFGRAEEVDPRNARIKAGLARALLLLEKPREALKLFDDAKDLGMDEALLAGDRGLAYDLRGDSRRAQRDYALALKRGPDPEMTRRMALSLGISGDREQALQLLEPLLRVQDRAAWRAQAFVLAMVGDVDEANRVARQVMPGNLAKPMGPFFERMAGLSASQKAAAVHFGAIPSDGRSSGALYAALDSAPASASSSALSGRASTKDPDEPDFDASGGPAPAESASTDNGDPAAVGEAVRQATLPEAVRLARATPPPQTIPSGAATTTTTRTPGKSVSANKQPAPVPVRFAQASPPPQSGGGGSPIITATRPSSSPSSVAGPGFSQSPVARQTGAAGTTGVAPSSFSLAAAPRPTPAAPPPSQAAPSRSLATIVGGLELEKTETVPIPVPAARKPEPKPVPAAAKPAEKKAPVKKPEPKKPDPKKAEPERIWAQIATGANAKALATDYGKMVKKSPAAFKGMTGWTVPFRGTRRLLVGPFASTKKAEDFLKKAAITGFAWTSPAGTEIEKLAAR